MAVLESSLISALEAQNAGKLQGAVAKWQQILDGFPEDPRGYSGLGTILRQLNRFDDADSVLAVGIDKFADDEKIRIARAWVAHGRGDWAEANKRWSEIRGSFPQCFDGFFGGGAVLRVLRRFDEADALYRQAFSRFPISSGLVGDFAAVAQSRGDLTEASRRWIVLRTLFPDRLEGLLREARSLRESALYSEAEKVLHEAIKFFPGTPAAPTEFAQLAQARSRWSEALHRWDAVATEFPGLVDGYLGAAQCLNEVGRFADAQNALQPAIRMFPDSAAVASLSAWTEHYRGNFLEAVARWKKFRDRFETNSLGFIGGAASLVAAGKVDEASAIMDTACALFPQDVQVATQWARVPQHVQNWDGALQRWESVFRRFSDIPAVKAGYAMALLSAGKADEAEKMLELATHHDTGSIEVYQAYAECGSKRRDWSVAVERWRKVVKKFPERVIAWTGLGEALRNAGQFESSLSVLREALDRFPDHVDVERHIAVTMSVQRNWISALPLWENLKRKYPRHSGVLSGITQALWQARQDLGVLVTESQENSAPFEIPSLLIETEVSSDDAGALRNLFLQFESIGDTCEFGIVQRRFGAEPISLLRWASTQPTELVTALDTQFEGVGDAEHTIIQASHGEYTTRDRRYHMFSHTFTPETAETLEKFTAQHLRRMQYLRRKLIDDLGSGEKVFIYKSNHGVSDGDARAIFRAIRKYGGQSALLCVRLQDESHPPGALLTLEDGLFVGYIDRFSTIDINVDVWVELCKGTLSKWQKSAELLPTLLQT